MLTMNDLRVVLIEALQGAADGLRDEFESTPPPTEAEPPEAVVVDPDPVEAEPTQFGGRLLVSITDAAKALGVGRTVLYSLISSGELTTVTIGRRRLVPVKDLHAFVESLR